jgi:hypothetical protein
MTGQNIVDLVVMAIYVICFVFAAGMLCWFIWRDKE